MTLARMSAGMDEARPRLRPLDLADQAPHSRAELVRYFAWGYLSRRELTDRLRPVDSEGHEALRHPAA